MILHRASQSFFPAPALYTQSLFRTKTVTRKHVYTHTHTFYKKRFYTETLLHTNTFYTQTRLHTNTFTHRHFNTETHSHRNAETYRITGVLYAKEKKMLQMIRRKKIEMTCEDSKLKSDEVHRKSDVFHAHTFFYAHTLLYTDAFADGHTHTQTRTSMTDTHTHTW